MPRKRRAIKMNRTVLATIKDHVLREVGEKQTPAVSITFDITEDLETKEAASGSAYSDLWLTPSCIDRTLNVLQEACGWTGEDLSELNGTGLLKDREVQLVLGDETYNGETREKVKFINKVGFEGKKKPMADDKTKVLAASLKGRVLAFRQKTPAVKAAINDGLPF
jgi:hypothetical protein